MPVESAAHLAAYPPRHDHGRAGHACPELSVALLSLRKCNPVSAKKYLPCEQRDEARHRAPETIFFAWESLRTH